MCFFIFVSFGYLFPGFGQTKRNGKFAGKGRRKHCALSAICRVQRQAFQATKIIPSASASLPAPLAKVEKNAFQFRRRFVLSDGPLHFSGVVHAAGDALKQQNILGAPPILACLLRPVGPFRYQAGKDGRRSQGISQEEYMRKMTFALLIVLIFGVGYMASAQSKSDNNAAGTWSGSWTGGSTGKFEMIIKKDAEGKLSATLSGTPDQGESYTIHSTLIESNGSKLTMKFEGPDGEAEAKVQAVIEGASMKGDYSIRAKASGEEVEKGTFTGARK